ncbi:MAG: PrsW family intramembrane metalloprotease [Anaerolineae bacterium]|nr:PrsW family intramembrane metalloprotease [Anaerolineae bacterium]
MDLSTVVLPSVVAAVVPTVIYAIVVWWLDRYEKEPLWLLSVAFIWGAVPAVVISFVLESSLGISEMGLSELLGNLLDASVVAPIIEESAKALALLGIYIVVRHEFDGVLDGIVYGALIGFGFGMTENALYFMSNAMEGSPIEWNFLVFMRSIVFGLNHAFYTSLTGAALGYARLSRKRWERWLVPLIGLSAAVFFHTVHNLFATLAEYVCFSLGVSVLSQMGGLLILLVILILAWGEEKEQIEKQLTEEVTGGVITKKEYAIIGSYRRRVAAWWKALSDSGWRAARQQGRLFKLATELAFAKRRQQKRGADRKSDARIGKLRIEIEQLHVEMYPDDVRGPGGKTEDEGRRTGGRTKDGGR